MGNSAIVAEKKLVPFWERGNDEKIDRRKQLIKKGITITKAVLYSFSGFMVLWSFIQSFFGWVGYKPDPGHGLEFGYLPGPNGTQDVAFDLGSWSVAGPGYHAFFSPGVVFGPFLSWFVYPIAKMFLNLMWAFYSGSEFLKRTGLYAICAMLVVMAVMRFITFWPTLRSSVLTEKQFLHQHALDNIHAKYEKFDPQDRDAKMRKHQEIMDYNRKHGLKPFAVLENFFIITPIFLIVFKIVTICRPIKFVNLFGIWDLSKTPKEMVFGSFLDGGWHYLLLCMVIIPFNFFSQRISTFLTKIRNPHLKKIQVNKNSQSYKTQRIQKIMTIVFLCFAFFWSTSLAIYYFFNSIFTILQNLIIHWILLRKKSKENKVEMKLKKLGINA